MIAAAWLHDIFDHSEYPRLESSVVIEKFGVPVAFLLMELKPGDRESVEDECLRLSTASARAKTIKLADLIATAFYLVNCVPESAPDYLDRMEALLSVLGDGDPELLARAKGVLKLSHIKLQQGVVPTEERWVRLVREDDREAGEA